MRICSGAGCLRTIPDGARFCAECQPVQVAPDGIREHGTGYTDELDRQRKSPKWQGVRARAMQRHPFCARCNEVTEIIDHIVPAGVAVQQVRDSGRYPLDPWLGYYLASNLQGLCRKCHYAKTLEDKTHVGPWDSVLDAEDRAPKKRWTF
jgi:hypothetical protein